MGPPVVQDAGYMGDAVGVLHQPKHEVVVLAAVEPRRKSADVDSQCPPVHPQMAGVHQSGHVLRRPAGLGVPLDQAPVIDDILVGIDHVDVRFGRDPVGNRLEGVGGEHVVVVQQRDILSGGELQRGIRGDRDPACGLPSHEADARVRGGVTLQRGDDLVVGGAVIDQAQLPVSEHLCSNGGDCLLEHLRGRVVDGRQDRDQRHPLGASNSSGREPLVGWRTRDRRRQGIDDRWVQPDRPRNGQLSQRVHRPDAESQARARAGNRRLTWTPRGRPRSDTHRMAPQSSRSSPAASVTATEARTAPRPSRQSCGSSIARAENEASPESVNGTVNVAPAGTSSARPNTPSGCSSQLAPADASSRLALNADNGSRPVAGGRPFEVLQSERRRPGEQNGSSAQPRTGSKSPRSVR